VNGGDNLLYVALAVIVALVAALILQFVSKRMLEQQLLERVERERKTVERGQRQMAGILEQLPLGIVAVEGGTHAFEFANETAAALLMGRAPSKLPLTDVDGRPLEPARNPFIGIAAPSDPVPACLVDAAGETRHLSIGSMMVHDEESGEDEVVYTIEDRTEHVRTELALARSHRLEAMGTLTRGVAHDLNNMLTPILGGLDLVRRDPSLAETSANAVQRAMQATGRASTLVHRLLAFAREQELDPHPVGLKALVEGAVDLFGRKLGTDITTFITARGNPWVEIDPNQFELVMLNLMTNARDAMPNGGELRIAIEEERLVDAQHGLPAGDYVRMSVTDDGVGMSDEVRRRAVEPFYTTKAPGEASGLGLSMVDGFAGQSGGAIEIDSTPGQGTRIDMWLPRNDVPATPAHDADADASARPARILLVDDEDLVRHATADMLVDLGHEVVQASSGAEGVAIARRDRTIDAIVADHLMPGMTGGAMVHEIWDFDDTVPALLISGYAQDRAMPSDMTHLAKPFRRADLAKAVTLLVEQRDARARA
jgi:signal transduction histidine kinase